MLKEKMVSIKNILELLNNSMYRSIAIIMLFAMFISVLPTRNVSASGTISGTVYIDYNMNGVRDTSGVAPNYAIDKGFGPVTVTVFAPDGSSKSAVANASTGLYSINTSAAPALPAGPYRVEFSSLPSNYFPSSVGTNNDTTVQFVNDGGSTNVDFGIVSQKEYCQNNPELVTNCYINGNETTGDVLLSFPYSAGAATTTTTIGPYRNPSTHTLLIDQTQIGPTWGLAYARNTKRIYAASFFKKHTNFGPNGPGAIYKINPENNSVVQTIAVPGATTNSHGTTDVCAGTQTISDCDNGNVGWDAVGKTALGGMAISDDEANVYVMNLENRTLYELDAVSGAATRWQAMPGVPNVTGSVNNLSSSGNLPPGAAGSATNVRPFAVSYLGGKIYVGVVTSAETTPSTLGNLRAHVYEVEPSTFAFTLRFSTALNYNRNSVLRFGSSSNSADWNAWRTTYATVGALNTGLGALEVAYPQPILVGIDFDSSGNLVLGIRDRAGDQLGHFSNSDPLVSDLFIGESAGDTLKACGNQTSGWTIESNSRCGGQGNGTQNNGQGVGNGEFYYGDQYDDTTFIHDETTLGGLEQLGGRPNIAMTVFDPASLSDQSGAFSAGVKWFVNSQGNAPRSYNIYSSSFGSSDETFAKANGLGDLVSMCDVAPLQVGNRVWNDTDNDGVQDPGENSIPNVDLELWADTTGDGTPDTRVGTATTDASGNYVFGGAANDNLGTYSCGAPVTQTVTTPISSSTDDGYQLNDGTIGDRLTRNFVVTGGIIGAAGFRFQNINVPQGTTITNAYIQFTANNGPNSSGSPTYTITGDDYVNAPAYSGVTNGISSRPDLGGGVTWNVPTWSTSGESGADQRTPPLTTIVQAQLNRLTWASGNAMSFTITSNGTTSRRDIESFDGNSASAARLVIEYMDTPTCQRELEPNTAYEVRVPESNFNSGQALNGLAPTTPDNDGTTNGDTRDSDGIVLSGSQVIAPFTTGGNGNNNHSYDFGFKDASTGYSVGNRIWYDVNNNGIIDVDEPGIPNTSVSIFLDADGNGTPDTPGSPINTVTTDAKGYYRFDGLAANEYVIRVNSSNFTGGVLDGYQNTSNTATPTDDGIESMGAASNAENGVDPTNGSDVAANGILSNSFELGATAEVLVENDVANAGSFIGQGSLDNQADMTVDFGFYALSLSGTLWQDTGVGLFPLQVADNGTLDSNETRISNIRVRLYDSAGNEVPVGLDGILGTADDTLSGVFTDGNGDYSFQGLTAGDYRVVVDGANGTSSTPTEDDPEDNGDDNDNGFPDNTGNFPNRIISGIVTLTPGNLGAAGNNSVTPVDGKTANPTVDFGFLLAPTLVKMDKLGAYFDGSNVVVEWSTGDEVGNLGFNVYREANGQRELLTNAPVAGSALKTSVAMEVKGNSYRWIDKDLKYGGMYYIEDIDVDGNRTLHGPVQPQMKFGFDGYSYNQPSSKLMSDMVETRSRSTQKEFVSEEIADTTTSVENLFSNDSVADLDKQREVAALGGAKLFVTDAGWYRVSIDQLARTGFNVNSSRDQWQLFVGGAEVPMQIGKDAIEFYGEGVDTNITDEQVYYLVEGKQTGMRLRESKGGQVDGEASVFNYDVTVQRKDRSFYLPSLLNGERENWFGALIFPTTATTQMLNVSDPYDDGTNQAIIKVRLQGLTDVNHLVNVRFNDFDLGVVQYTGKGNREFEFSVPMSALYSDVNAVTLQSVGANNDISLVDTVSLRYTKGYTANNGQIRFTIPAYQVAKVGGFDQKGIEVFEIGLDGNVIGKVKINEQQVDGKYGFEIAGTSYDQEFLAVNQNEFSRTVERVEVNDPSTLNARDNKAEFVIITPNLLSKEADELAIRRQSQGWNTKVVTVEDIYDEYSFGRRSNNAIKAFLEDASNNWELQPGYVLLFGDSNADHRNYLDQEDRDLIPTKFIDTQFSETSSDSWLADFDEDGIEDLALGRLPVGNSAEARYMLAKLQRFDNQKGRVKNTNLLVADNLFENYNDSLEARLPQDAGARRINRSQVSDPQMRQEIISNMALNPMVVTYTGHGSTGVWASANVLRDTDVAAFSNDKLAFFMLMTCLNGYTHSPYNDSLAEVLMKSENGAIATWASSGSTYASGQILMSQQATSNLFNGENNPLPIGDITRSAKRTTTDVDARRTWQLIGDPTIVIK